MLEFLSILGLVVLATAASRSAADQPLRPRSRWQRTEKEAEAREATRGVCTISSLLTA